MKETVEVPVFDLEGEQIMLGTRFPSPTPAVFLLPVPDSRLVYFTEQALLYSAVRRFYLTKDLNGEGVYLEGPRV